MKRLFAKLLRGLASRLVVLGVQCSPLANRLDPPRWLRANREALVSTRRSALRRRDRADLL